MKWIVIFYLIIGSINGLFAQTIDLAFQPFNTQGDNLIHVTTADFDGIGVKDYVVAMTAEGKLIAFQRPDLITDPAADMRLWEYHELPSMGIRIIAEEAISSSVGEEVILPGTDGYLRILSSSGELLAEKKISSGALYTAAVAKGVDGQTIIVTAGVDGYIYFLNTSLIQLAKREPQTENKTGVSGVIRHVVAGDFNGDGTDEIMSFVNNKGFSGNCFFDITDLNTYSRPLYWNGLTSANADDVAPALGFTDKQLPHAYDMDGDGDEEVVGHWGVFHPEDGPRTQLFSTMLAANETLHLERYELYAKNYLIQNHGFVKEDKEDLTKTGKYLLQHGVPGDFDGDGEAELFTVYGDDLFLSDYDAASKSINISAYTWAHSMYHFTDAACLEDRSGGADKIVLAGPINGDDHFYVVEPANDQWRTDARNIYCAGTFGEVESNLDQLTSAVNQFSGEDADGNEPIWYVDYFASGLWWEMTPANCEIHAQEVYDAQQVWYDKIGGQENYRSSRIRLAASINSAIWGVTDQATKETVTAEGMVEFCRALAQKGAYFCLNIGHGNHIYMYPETLADCYEASVVNGECYMMARTKELLHPEYFDLYKPHLDAVIARAEMIGEEPPMVMLAAKGPIISSMSLEQGEDYFPKYKDVFVPGVENSNVTMLEWSLAERVGLWMNGDVERWGCNVIGDNLAANRVAEWGGMRNAHVVLRQMLSQYALGAQVFRVTSVTGLENPMYERGDVSGEDQVWSQPFQKGVLNFLKIVEKGIYPHSPETNQLKAISPVSVALYNGSERLKEQSINHDYYKYAPETDIYVFNRMACWNAYTDIPDTDITSFLYGTRRRWENLLPSTVGGFIPIVPHSSAEQLESNSWCKIAFQTNGDYWSGYSSLEAKDLISEIVMNRRQTLDFYVEGDCFWQITQQKDDPYTYYVLLMGNNVLSPLERTVKFKAGNTITGSCQVFDQLSTLGEPLGVLYTISDEVELTIPAGAPRVLRVKLSSLPVAVQSTENSIPFTMNIYPNPVLDELFIELSEAVDSEIFIHIYDEQGKEMLRQKQGSGIQRIDVSHWSPGIYQVCAISDDNKTLTKVLVNMK